MWGAGCQSYLSVKLAALQVLLRDAQVGGKQLWSS